MRTRRRNGYEKSRNGCLTCRVRRVKCDETKPCCRRCTETGRKCEGPTVGQIQFVRDCLSMGEFPTASKPLPVEVSLFAPQHTEVARRAFHYFRHHAMYLISVPIDASFWRVVLPLAHKYSFVWNSIVSVSILHEHVPYPSLPPTWDSTEVLPRITNREHLQALRFYNRAIANVRQLAERGQIDDSAAVLSYVLFAGVEFGQENVKTATDLWRKSCKILTKELTTSFHAQHNSTAEARAIHEVITPMSLRKAMTMATLGNGPSPADWTTDDEASREVLQAVLSKSPWLNKARVHFHSLIYEAYEVVRVTDFVVGIKNVGDSHKVLFSLRHQSRLDALLQWKVSFTTATSSRGPGDLETKLVCSYLLMYWAVCYISLAACNRIGETTFDDYIEPFAEVVEHAAFLLNYRGSASAKIQLLLSSFEPGVIPPLYFCGMKCRDPTLRRTALQLLRQASRHESLWAFVMPDRVVAKVIAVEERTGEVYQLPSFSSDSRFPKSEYYADQKLPPEERRVTHASVVNRQSYGGRQRQALELSRFESAGDGSRKLIIHYIWLDEGEETWSPCSP